MVIISSKTNKSLAKILKLKSHEHFIPFEKVFMIPKLDRIRRDTITSIAAAYYNADIYDTIGTYYVEETND